jgi:hypothetical protein
MIKWMKLDGMGGLATLITVIMGVHLMSHISRGFPLEVVVI